MFGTCPNDALLVKAGVPKLMRRIKRGKVSVLGPRYAPKDGTKLSHARIAYTIEVVYNLKPQRVRYTMKVKNTVKGLKIPALSVQIELPNGLLFQKAKTIGNAQPQVQTDGNTGVTHLVFPPVPLAGGKSHRFTLWAKATDSAPIDTPLAILGSVSQIAPTGGQSYCAQASDPVVVSLMSLLVGVA